MLNWRYAQWPQCSKYYSTVVTAEAPPLRHTACLFSAAINDIISQTILTTWYLFLIVWFMNGIVVYYLGFSKIRPSLAEWKLCGSLPHATLCSIPFVFLHIGIIGRTRGRSLCGSLTKIPACPHILLQSLFPSTKISFLEGQNWV